MLLREVHLANVGLYRGSQVIRLATDPKRPVTLVGGRNGSGKTTLLEAIPVALYGVRARQVLGARSYARHLDELIHDGQKRASITLVFDRRVDGRDLTYIVDRTWRPSGADGAIARDRLSVTVDGEPRPDLEASWSEYVERILPLSLSGLAMFDGERIEALANVHSAAEVLKTSLYGLLGLNLIDQLRRDLSELRRRRARMTHATTDLQAALEKAEDGLEAAKDRHIELQDEHDIAIARLKRTGRQLAQAQDRLSTSGGDLFAHREALHTQRAELRDRRVALAARLMDLVRGDLPLLLVAPLTERVVEVGTAGSDAAEARLLTRRLKERDARIVGRLDVDGALSKDQVALVASILDADREGYERDHQVPFFVSPAAGGTAHTMVDGGFDSLNDTLSGLLTEMSTVDEDLAHVSGALAKVPDEQAVAELVQAVTVAEQAFANDERDVARLEAELAKTERLIESLEVKVDEASQQIIQASASAADEVRIVREVNKAQATLERFQTRIVAKNVDHIRANVLESFRTLIRKDTLVTDLTIDPDTLAIGLVGHSGKVLDPDRLSAGERQTLATALLWGLSKSTGRTLPTIIDTPVGRLDSSHRKKLVTRYFPNASRQVVLLSTDEEVVGEYREAIRGKVGAEYLLDYDPKTNATTVREGYFE